MPKIDKKSTKTAIYFTFGVAVAGLWGSASCSESRANEGQIAPPIPTSRVVRALEVDGKPLVRSHRYSGVVRAANRADLTFTLSGRVSKRPAQVGATVKRGAALAVLDRRPLRNALSAAKARRATLETRLDQLGRDAQRADRLRAADAIGEEEREKTVASRDTVASQLRAAAADVSEATRLLGEATLRAPFEGTIVEVLIEPGEFAQAGRTVVRLSGERSAEIELEVPDNLRPYLVVGDDAAVRLPLGDGPPIVGRIERVGRGSAGIGRLIKVIVALPAESDVSAGTTAEVVLRSKLEAAIAVPVAAVVDPSGSRPALFRITAGVATLVPVALGRIVGDRVVVRSGLSNGDTVVIAGHANLVSGESVEISGIDGQSDGESL